MQSFQSKVQRIPGSRMGLADHMSRMYLEDADETVKEVLEDDIAVITEMALHLFLLNATTPDTESSLQTSTSNGKTTQKDVNDYLRDCHGGRKFHSGVWRTWITLNKTYPGHRINIEQVRNFVNECPICQKNSSAMNDYVEPIRKHLKVDHPRKRLGYDTLSVTPDESGYSHLDVFVDLFNHHVQLYPARNTQRKHLRKTYITTT